MANRVPKVVSYLGGEETDFYAYTGVGDLSFEALQSIYWYSATGDIFTEELEIFFWITCCFYSWMKKYKGERNLLSGISRVEHPFEEIHLTSEMFDDILCGKTSFFHKSGLANLSQKSITLLRYMRSPNDAALPEVSVFCGKVLMYYHNMRIHLVRIGHNMLENGGGRIGEDVYPLRPRNALANGGNNYAENNDDEPVNPVIPNIAEPEPEIAAVIHVAQMWEITRHRTSTAQNLQSAQTFQPSDPRQNRLPSESSSDAHSHGRSVQKPPIRKRKSRWDQMPEGQQQ